MDAAQWPQIKANTQGIGMEGSRGTTITDQRRTRPEKDKQELNCPRCNSTNTKFCYYNNYSLSQPRYFCKGCRRYWTAGGSLRNVPVGGGSRKNKRSSSSSSPSPSSSKKQLLPHDLTPPNNFSSQNPKMINNQNHDLNLAYPPNSTSNYMNSNSTPFSSSIYTSGFSLNFSLDGFGNSGYYENLQGVQETNARVFFPFEELKLEAPRSSTTDHFEQNNIAVRGGEGDQASGYWSGMLGGGGGSSW